MDLVLDHDVDRQLAIVGDCAIVIRGALTDMCLAASPDINSLEDSVVSNTKIMLCCLSLFDSLIRLYSNTWLTDYPQVHLHGPYRLLEHRRRHVDEPDSSSRYTKAHASRYCGKDKRIKVGHRDRTDDDLHSLGMQSLLASSIPQTNVRTSCNALGLLLKYYKGGPPSQSCLQDNRRLCCGDFCGNGNTLLRSMVSSIQ